MTTQEEGFGALSGSQASPGANKLSPPIGFDPGREAFTLLAALHDALVLTANYNPQTDVVSFTEHAAEFDRASQFLRNSQEQSA